MEHQKKSARDAWGTRLGFILAAVGSAVGLGNMWRFSYVAAEGGGAAFVLLYLVFVAIIGIPLVTSEFIIGRMAQVSPAVAVKRMGGPWWSWLGWLFVFCGFGILSYYSVIAGWTMHYAFDAIRHAIPANTAAYFAQVGTGISAIIWHLLFMAITIFIVIGGVKQGLERSALILMPMLFLLLLGLAIWALTLKDGGTGYAYYLKPQLSELSDPKIISLAAGQAFFSLSLGMGALMTYASYLRSHENLFREAATVALTDFGVAFIAGLVIFPIIFHFSLQEKIGLGAAISDNTVGTLFITLPTGLQELGTMGDWIVAAFFIMLFFAAITSAISLLEVVVAAFIDRWGFTRKKATVTLGIAIALLGIPSALDLNVLNLADKFVGNFLLVVGGLFTSLLIGYRLLPEADFELSKGLQDVRARRAWSVFVRYVIPLVLIAVIAFTLTDVIQAIQGLLGEEVSVTIYSKLPYVSNLRSRPLIIFLD